jgi:hypothetical protein
MIELLDKRRYTLPQIARRADVHPGTVWRWVTSGVRGTKLPSVRVGGRLYVLEDDLDAFIESSNELTSGPYPSNHPESSTSYGAEKPT